MSPEQIQDSGSVSEPADVYSLGVILYEMLAGGLPAGRPLLGAPCPIELARFIQRMQSFDPQQRPSAAEVAEELARMRTAVPLVTPVLVTAQAPIDSTETLFTSASTPTQAPKVKSNAWLRLGLPVGAVSVVVALAVSLLDSPQGSKSPRNKPPMSLPKQEASAAALVSLQELDKKDPSRVSNEGIANNPSGFTPRQPESASTKLESTNTAIPQFVQVTVTSKPSGAQVSDERNKILGLTPWTTRYPRKKKTMIVLIKKTNFITERVPLDLSQDQTRGVKLVQPTAITR